MNNKQPNTSPTFNSNLHHFYSQSLPSYIHTLLAQSLQSQSDLQQIQNFNSKVQDLLHSASEFLNQKEKASILLKIFDDSIHAIILKLEQNSYDDRLLKWRFYLQISCLSMHSMLLHEQINQNQKVLLEEKLSLRTLEIEKILWRIRLNYQFTADIGASQAYVIQVLRQIFPTQTQLNTRTQKQIEKFLRKNQFDSQAIIQELFQQNLKQLSPFCQPNTQNFSAKRKNDYHQGFEEIPRNPNNKKESNIPKEVEQIPVRSFKKFRKAKKQLTSRTLSHSFPMKYKTANECKQKIEYIETQKQIKKKSDK